MLKLRKELAEAEEHFENILLCKTRTYLVGRTFYLSTYLFETFPKMDQLL